MDDDRRLTTTINELLPERLYRLRRTTGLPVAFGGVLDPSSSDGALVLTRLAGTMGKGLRGLHVPPGLGLGGMVLDQAAPQRVDNYASTTSITHDYDHIVIGQERLTSLVAVPVVALGRVRGVLYAGVRSDQPIGDRALKLAGFVAGQLAEDAVKAQRHPVPPRPSSMIDVVGELADIIAATDDPELRARLEVVRQTISRSEPAGFSQPAGLAPREIDTLRLVELGETNAEIAARLGLSPETVKAYLRTAMSKLDVSNRTAAVRAARQAGAL